MTSQDCQKDRLLIMTNMISYTCQIDRPLERLSTLRHSTIDIVYMTMTSSVLACTTQVLECTKHVLRCTVTSRNMY